MKDKQRSSWGGKDGRGLEAQTSYVAVRAVCLFEVSTGNPGLLLALFELVSSDGSPNRSFPFLSTPLPPALASLYRLKSSPLCGEVTEFRFLPLDGLAFVQVESRIVLKTCVCSRDFHGWPL